MNRFNATVEFTHTEVLGFDEVYIEAVILDGPHVGEKVTDVLTYEEMVGVYVMSSPPAVQH